MSSRERPATVFFGRPQAQAYDFPYEPPPKENNPVVRGWLLYVLAELVAVLSFLQDILWSNAHFGDLRNRKELDDIEPRYNPLVIRSTGVAATPGGDDGTHLAAIAAEDWSRKAPSTSAYSSCLDYHDAYRRGTLTPLAVAETLLPLVRRETNGPHAVAFLSVRAELVRHAAQASTARWRAGKPLSLLDGVPIAVKDEADLTGYRKSLGSRLDYTDPADATSVYVARLQAAGAVCLGKTTMHELGMDVTNNNPVHGTPPNPYNASYYTGGSSGGSAYAVAAGLVPIALGNDAGGSIRIPAAYCGAWGLKTTHGRVSGRPTVSLAKSTGVAGPIAANMIDLELAYRIMAQPDPLDPDSALFLPPGPAAHEPHTQKLLGIYKPWFDRADAAVQNTCWRALDRLTTQHGYRTVDITLPLIHAGQLAHAITVLAELAAGTPASTTGPLTAPNKILLAVARRTPAADFLLAQRLRTLLMRHLAHLFAAHPGLLLVTPTTPRPAPPRHPADAPCGLSDADATLRAMEFVWLANLSGCPALTAPVGVVAAPAAARGGNDPLPVGLMAMAEWCADEALLAWGYDVEAGLRDEGRAAAGTREDVLGMAGAGEG